MHPCISSGSTDVFVSTSFLLTSLGSSITNFLVELYIVLRLFSLPVARRARLRDRLLGAKVLAITRVSSLVVFDALTVVPDAIQTGIFAQFIPFSVGALVVLGQSCLLYDFVSCSPSTTRRIMRVLHYGSCVQQSPGVYELTTTVLGGEL